MSKIFNSNAVFKEMKAKFPNITYIKVAFALEVGGQDLTSKEKQYMMSVLQKNVDEIKQNFK